MAGAFRAHTVMPRACSYRPIAALVFAMAWLLAGCGPKPPILIGFLGGASNQASSFSEEGRNGTLLRIEQINQAGGVQGRRLELVVQDYPDGAGKATLAFQALAEAGVSGIIGPYSSAAAAELGPVADSAGMLMLSPISRGTAADVQTGHLLRVGRIRRDEAQAVAAMARAAGIRRMALATDMRSAAYANSWSADFRERFLALGAESVVEVPFGRGSEPSFSGIAQRLLSSRPDGVLFVTSSADAARLAQQVARLAPGMFMTASGRAISDVLLELGGQAVEGMVLVQPYHADDTSPRYRAFRDAYVARFGQVPTYSAMVSYDAMGMLEKALSRRRPDESLRDAMFRGGPHQGLQETIRLDPVADAPPRAWFSIVRKGRFEALP